MRCLFPFTSQRPAHLQISNGEAAALMPRTVYLEAPAKSQHLLTTKWTLRSCGHVIASTWHEESRLASSGPQSHWAWQRLEGMKSCDALVVIGGPEKELPLELAFTVGFAAAHNLQVIWLGSPIDLPGGFRAIHFVATLDELQKQLLENDSRQTCSSGDLVAA
jgi:hypothetical protein